MHYHAEHPARLYQEPHSLKEAVDCHLTTSQSGHCSHTENKKIPDK